MAAPSRNTGPWARVVRRQRGRLRASSAAVSAGSGVAGRGRQSTQAPGGAARRGGVRRGLGQPRGRRRGRGRRRLARRWRGIAGGGRGALAGSAWRRRPRRRGRRRGRGRRARHRRDARHHRRLVGAPGGVLAGHPRRSAVRRVLRRQPPDDGRAADAGRTTWTLTRLPTTLGWDSHNYVVAGDRQRRVHPRLRQHARRAADLLPQHARARRQQPAARDRDGRQQRAGLHLPAVLPRPDRQPDVRLPRRRQRQRQLHLQQLRRGRPDLDAPAQHAAHSTAQGPHSAYPVGPLLGPDGCYHIVWVWRDTPDAATNHDHLVREEPRPGELADAPTARR